jgi:hypothetical protein
MNVGQLYLLIAQWSTMHQLGEQLRDD